MSVFFYLELMLNVVKCFFCVHLDDTVIFILLFDNPVYHVDCLVATEPSWARSLTSERRTVIPHVLFGSQELRYPFLVYVQGIPKILLRLPMPSIFQHPCFNV